MPATEGGSGGLQNVAFHGRSSEAHIMKLHSAPDIGYGMMLGQPAGLIMRCRMRGTAPPKPGSNNVAGHVHMADLQT